MNSFESNIEVDSNKNLLPLSFPKEHPKCCSGSLTITLLVGSILLAFGLLAIASYLAPNAGGSFIRGLQELKMAVTWLASRLGMHVRTFAIASAAIGLTMASMSAIGLCLNQRIFHAYQRAIGRFVKHLRKRKWYGTASVLGTLLQEPLAAIRAGLLRPTASKTHFNFYGMNPKKLTEAQAKQKPVLLLHGNMHDQSAWLGLAKQLKKHHKGPVFTVNLPSGKVTSKDFDILNKKLEEIEVLYNEHEVFSIKTDLVAHSRGGQIAANLMIRETSHPKIGKIITIGYPLDKGRLNAYSNYSHFDADRLYAITGKYDILDPDLSELTPNHQIETDTGHLGLLYASTTHQYVIHWLK